MMSNVEHYYYIKTVYSEFTKEPHLCWGDDSVDEALATQT